MKRFLIPSLLILTLILAACSATPASLPTDPAPDSVSSSDSAAPFDSAMRTDGQGAIIFEITPININAPTESLEFEIILTTHSIDLSMDLATQATLTTDTGLTVQATLWDAPRGGHHVEGKLIFPASVDGKSILDGATKLTLTILNVDAPSRVFEWEVQ
ncbi:MAG: hypothetical protein HY867_18835 [Chloroflexi bacterium]|nr:hypothetical protein [Chloroflexota bacterium]